jgi:hypothetical protein
VEELLWLQGLSRLLLAETKLLHLGPWINVIYNFISNFQISDQNPAIFAHKNIY